VFASNPVCLDFAVNKIDCWVSLDVDKWKDENTHFYLWK